ncbi:alpha-amylase [Parapedobacter sp. 2B3]|uniref:alpha-amylase n=1 Tax=Parapedobacter sp. 2B3 TaxID=3342381 RepID=UPI0035B63DA6
MENGTLFQFFEWYYPADGTLWNHLKAEASRLKALGIDAVWLPPAGKGMDGPSSSGYDSYDLYDLGEFDQKGSIRTKYGTKEELLSAVHASKLAGLQVYCDIVLNHMGGGDEKETIAVRRVNPHSRNDFLDGSHFIEAYTKFTFPGRNGQHSAFIWDYQCFSGLDHNALPSEAAIYCIQNQYGSGWQDVAGRDDGNADYLMLTDIDFRNPAVVQELTAWGKWFCNTVGCDGFRLDAVKHINPEFLNQWLDTLRDAFKREFFTVGEYWAPEDPDALLQFIETTGGRMSLFDAPLQRHFSDASKCPEMVDLRRLFDGTLVLNRPQLAVTLVENHDTQPLQASESTVERWFRPIAYTIILLRKDGYPCIFYSDLYGSAYRDTGGDGHLHDIVQQPVDELAVLLYVRKQLAYGTQHDYIDNARSIGWTREGERNRSGSSCAVLISTDAAVSKTMYIGKQHARRRYVDCLGHVSGEVVVHLDGTAAFHVAGKSVSVWILAE